MTQRFHCRGHGFDPWGTKIPHAAWCDHIKLKKKQKQKKKKKCSRKSTAGGAESGKGPSPLVVGMVEEPRVTQCLRGPGNGVEEERHHS